MAKYRVKREPVVQPQDQSIRHIPLTQGQVAIVSAQRYEYLMQWNWYARWDRGTQSFYAVRKNDEKSKQILMHAIILGLSDSELGDHRNGNTLDNTDGNLRKCSRHENAYNCRVRKCNTSGYPGVHLNEDGLWRVRICVNGKRLYLGDYKEKERAIQVRKDAEQKHHGEFAISNRH